MASIDWTVLGLGALVGVGCRSELKACGRIAANTAASLAATAASAAKQVAEETQPTAESVAADAKVAEINEKINKILADLYGQGTKTN